MRFWKKRLVHYKKAAELVQIVFDVLRERLHAKLLRGFVEEIRIDFFHKFLQVVVEHAIDEHLSFDYEKKCFLFLY